MVRTKSGGGACAECSKRMARFRFVGMRLALRNGIMRCRRWGQGSRLNLDVGDQRECDGNAAVGAGAGWLDDAELWRRPKIFQGSNWWTGPVPIEWGMEWVSTKTVTL